MTADQYRTIEAFESGLQVDDTVRINWTTSGRFFSAIGNVAKVNDKSIIVKLTTEIPTEYPEGQKIKAPKMTMSTMKLWSVNNRVEKHE